MISTIKLLAELHTLMLFSLSLTICAVLILLARHVPRLTGSQRNTSAVQAMHSRPTPRVGGVGIFAVLAASTFFSSTAISEPYKNFVFATSTLFFVGLLEDLGFSVSPRKRLLAAVVASSLVMWLLAVWLPRVDIPALDMFIQHWAVGVPLTLLITVGIANGFNLIDGVNGLASFTAIVAALAMAAIAEQAGYTEMVKLTGMLAAGFFGFFLLNYPFGLIFLGDAGAYTIGFVLSWFGVSILLNAPEASAWAILLTLFWPVADTLLAIYRRMRRDKQAMAPDRLHVHQLVMRALEIHVLGRRRRHLANPLSTLVLAPFIVAPAITGAVFWDQNAAAFLGVVFYCIAFVASYLAAFAILPRLPRKRGRGRSSSMRRHL